MLFRCNQTGNTIEVKGDAAIASMLSMPHYSKVEAKQPEAKKETLKLKKDKQ